MTRALKGFDPDRLTLETELSPSMVYRELERYHVDIVFDPLAGFTNAALYFKLQNLRVIANDLSLSTYVKGKALWENNRFEISPDLAERLTDADAVLPEADHYSTLGEKWLLDTERRWLEYWRAVVNDVRDEYMRALAETAVCLVIEAWLTEKRFGTASNWAPNSLLGYYIGRISQSLLDNRESNEMWRMDPRELADKVIADVMFINPPPLKGYAAFGAREHIIESWLRGMSDYPLEKIAPSGSMGSAFGSVKDYLLALGELLKAADHIPIWAFTLSNRQPFTRLQFDALIRTLGRDMREVDLNIAKQFFSIHAADTIVIATK
jgi:hypothetical protein